MPNTLMQSVISELQKQTKTTSGSTVPRGSGPDRFRKRLYA
jgi:hypothetical protein